MKKLLLFPLIAIFLISCKKENSSFIDKYQMISGTWNLQFVSYDSSGVKITRTFSYNRLVIKDNLEYQIYNDLISQVEHGNINIITQTDDKLELYFDAQWPGYSSFIGSHVFGYTNVELVSLSDNALIIKSINASYAEYSDREFVFIR
jgi:hypothetical protein